MTTNSFTSKQFLTALEHVLDDGLPDSHHSLLQAHFDSEDHTTTWADLATIVGYANRNAVQLQYGRLAQRIAEQLGIAEPPNGFWLNVITDWAEHRDPNTGHTRFVLRPDFIEALVDSGLVRTTQTPTIATLNGREPEPPRRVLHTSQRIIRNTALAETVKKMHNFECQLCGHFIQLDEERRYAEAHHIRPLGEPHSGPDNAANILVLCPNHHVECDYGVIVLDLRKIRTIPEHTISLEYIEYHNANIAT